MADILPRDLDPAASVPANAALIVDNGTTVDKATPAQIVETGRPTATQPEAEAGADNTKGMTPLRTRQAILALSPLTSGNVAQTLLDLKAYDTAKFMVLYDGATFTWTTGNFTGLADDVNIVKADSTPLSTGAWVRQRAQSLTYTQQAAGAVTITQQQKNDQIVHISQFGVVPGTATDQRANVQKALDYAASLHPFGCTILFDPVDYRWDAPVIIKGHGTKLHFRNARVVYCGTGRAIDFGLVGGTSMPVECVMSEVNVDLTNAITPCDGVRWATSYSKAYKVNVLIPASFGVEDAGIELYNAGNGVINGPYYNEFEGCSVDSQSLATKHYGFRFAMNAPNYMGCNANTFINNRISGCLVGLRVNGTGCSFLGNNVETPAGTGTAYHFAAQAVGQCGGNIVCGGYIEGAAIAFKFDALSTGNFMTPPYGTGVGIWVDDATPGKSNGILSSNIPTILPTGVKIRGLSSDPEVLDAYLEGAFTPGLSFTTPGDLSVTYGANNSGTFTRIGNRVYFDLYLETTALTFTTASGVLQITGLPYVSGAATPATGVVGYVQGLSYVGRTQVEAQCDPTTTNLILALHGSGLATATAMVANVTSGTPLLLQISGCYRV